MATSIRIALVLVAVAIGGCSLTLPVRATLGDNSDDYFVGEATGYMNGSGDLRIYSQRSGRTCTGNFVYVTHREGEGVATCSDGATGSFHFVSTGQNGTGRGTIGGRTFVFTFGGSALSEAELSSAPSTR